MSPTFADLAPCQPRSRVLWQLAAVGAVCAILAIVGMQAAANLRARGISSGFAYLGRSAGFEIAPGPVPYSSRDTNARALAVGVVNTVRVAALGILAAAGIGVVVAVGRLSSLWGVAAAARAYVEMVRNVPLLLQILCWSAFLQRLPDAAAPWRPMAGITLTNRGLSLFNGGVTMSPEFTALFVALSIYTSAFISENVRGGIVAVSRGQKDAAAALGLSRLQALRAVVLPQALPVITPPTVSQLVSLMKNSSLAAAIGYPDLMSVTNTTINQTGQAVEATGLTMALYLSASLVIAILARRLLRTRHRA
jgi:general L-amino acid transport system permease protein